FFLFKEEILEAVGELSAAGTKSARSDICGRGRPALDKPVGGWLCRGREPAHGIAVRGTDVKRIERMRQAVAHRLDDRFLARPQRKKCGGTLSRDERGERVEFGRGKIAPRDLEVSGVWAHPLDVRADQPAARHGDERKLARMG